MLAGRVVVNVNCEFVFEPFDPGPVYVRALDYKDRVVFIIDGPNVADLLSTWKASVCDGHLPMNDHLRLLAETAKKPAKAKRRSNAVAVGLNVGGDTKLMFGFDQFNYLA
jgi:hypothetical protein